MKKILLTIGAVVLPYNIAAALSFTQQNLPYVDTPSDAATRVALSMLTDLQVIQGNDDGTFAPNRTLNRAEFVTIAMRLHADAAVQVTQPCFPDVAPNAWYATAVCQAKSLGILEGEQGKFSPDRAINFAEAVKVLVEVYSLPMQDVAGMWYEPYVRTAQSLGLLTDSLQPGVFITRAQMVRMAASFAAYSTGKLDQFRAAQLGSMSSSSTSSISSISSVASSSPASISSGKSSSSTSYTYDTYGDTNLQQSFILLGTVSPVLASVKIFSDTQPLDVTDISITLASSADSVESILVYDQEARLLGRASLRSGSTYTVSVRTMNLHIPRRENFSIYARAQLKPFTAGGVSGEQIEVSEIRIEGIGSWNNKDQAESSSDEFPTFQTARSRITVIENAAEDKAILVAGTNQLVGTYRFAGETGDGQADLALTSVSFQIESTGGVGISNVQLTADGTSDMISCAIATTVVNCTGIPALFGSFEDRERVLSLYADVTVPNSSVNQSLRLTLNQGGSPNSAGSVSWSDGSTTFTWVQFGNPVVRGTYYE